MRPATLYNQSLAYLDGKGVPVDLERSFALCMEAASQNYADAVLAMGWHYLNGVGTNPDPEQADWWYRKSARQGDIRAMFSLGQMAYTVHDYGTASLWLRRALDKGHARSGLWLAKVMWREESSVKARKTALKLAEAAAAANVVEAIRILRTVNRCKARLAV